VLAERNKLIFLYLVNFEEASCLNAVNARKANGLKRLVGKKANGLKILVGTLFLSIISFSSTPQQSPCKQ
jgi:hypothetical protein